jgi:ribosomal protein L37AE/L43A
MDHQGLRHHDKEHHFNEVDCPGCGKVFQLGKGSPSSCMQCGLDLRPMRSKTSPANAEDMRERNTVVDGHDTGGNSLNTGLMQTHSLHKRVPCPVCGDKGCEKHPDALKSDAKGLGKIDPYTDALKEDLDPETQKGWRTIDTNPVKRDETVASVKTSDAFDTIRNQMSLDPNYRKFGDPAKFTDDQVKQIIEKNYKGGWLKLVNDLQEATPETLSAPVAPVAPPVAPQPPASPLNATTSNWEIVEVIEPDSEITEAQHHQGLQFPEGITDALHEALETLEAWVENPEENGKLRPYKEYSDVIRPKINAGPIQIGVKDPHMAEIINDIARTGDLSSLEKESSIHVAVLQAAPLVVPEVVGLGAEGVALGLEGVGAGSAAAPLMAGGEALTGFAGGTAGRLLGSVGNLVKGGLGKAKNVIPGVGEASLKDLAKRYMLFKGAEEVGGAALGGIGDFLGISGDSGSGAAGGPAGPADAFDIWNSRSGSAKTSIYGQPLETPDSVSRRVDTEDPENVDPHEINDGDTNAINSYDPKNNGMGQGRSPRGEDKQRKGSHDSPAIKKFLEMLPLVLHYYTSDESGADDPRIIELHKNLEDEFPGYLNLPSVPAKENPILLAFIGGGQHGQKEAAGPAAPAMPMPGMAQAAPNAENAAGITQKENEPGPVAGKCMWHNQPMPCQECPPVNAESAAKAGDVTNGTDQSYVNRSWTSDPAKDEPQLEQAAAQRRQMQKQQSRVAAEHQGPHTKEQFIAVAELLRSEDRQDEIIEMMKNPNEFAEEMAMIQQTQSPEEDVSFDAQTAAPPAPAVTTPPPNQGMPVPPMKGPGPGGPAGGGMQMGASMLKAAFKYSADNVAGKCPKCKSHSTKMVKQDGMCKCHACGKTWKDKSFHPSDGDSSDSSTTASIIYSNQDIENMYYELYSNIHQANEELEDAYNEIHEEPTSAHTHKWTDSEGQPLEEDVEYSLRSVGVENSNPIPDIVRITEIKPDSISYVFIAHEKSGINDPETIPFEKFREEGLRFEPKSHGHDENHPGIEENADGKPLPEVGSDHTDLSMPHRETSKTAGKNYTPMEQRELIDESGEARNSDKLNLEGTHYVESSIDDQFLFGC